MTASGPEALGVPSRPGDILLITADTLRADHLGLYGYPRPTSPNLDAFFSKGMLIERAYSTSASTPPSVVSILTGLLPQEHRVRLYYQLVPESTAVLSKLLPDTYQTAAFVSNTVLTNDATGLAAYFDHYDDQMYPPAEEERRKNLRERNARRTTDATLTWLESERDADRPLFLWVHYVDPHGPYRAPEPEYAARFTHDEARPITSFRVPGVVREPGVKDGNTYIDHYDGEIAYMDAQIGRLLDGYAARASIDDAMVILTADHGESMMEHSWWFSHGYHVYEELIHVPFVLRGPGVDNVRLTGLGSALDIVPTVLGFAGTDVPEGLRGIDLRADVSLLGQRRVFAQASDTFAARKGRPSVWRTVIEGRRKWVVGAIHGQPENAVVRFYDLDADPKELEPVSTPPPSRAFAELRALITSDADRADEPKPARGRKSVAAKAAARATNEQVERLRALGYVE